MKRLKNILLKMDVNTSTFKELYEGYMRVIPYAGSELPYNANDNIYYDDRVSYEFMPTHKLAQDKATVFIRIPLELLGITSEEKTIAAADECLRKFIPYIDSLNIPLINRNRPDDEKGKYYCFEPDSRVIQRNGAYFEKMRERAYRYSSGMTVYEDAKLEKLEVIDCLTIMIQIQFPKKNTKKVMHMLLDDLPNSVNEFIENFDVAKLRLAIELFNTQNDIRNFLRKSEYCAFIANGSILPREGDTDLPKKKAIPFVSTKEDEIEVCGIKGMGIKRGVTVITGGGYSGKSTLLKAILAGTVNRRSGDGRELCICDADAMEIMAEDGRSVKNVNISPFIQWIPGEDTRHFSTDHASGSTSQAANICEAISFGTHLLLIDEDKSATNFMIRDRVMRQLVENEPITPFTDRVNELYQERRVSTILVIGGSSEYLSVADKILLMDEFKIYDVEKDSLDLSMHLSKNENEKINEGASWEQNRKYLAKGFTPYPENSSTEKIEINELGIIYIGGEVIDLRALSGIQGNAQQTAVAFIIRAMENSETMYRFDASRRLDTMLMKIRENGLESIFSSTFTNCGRFLEMPRKIDVLAVINRMRLITVTSDEA